MPDSPSDHGWRFIKAINTGGSITVCLAPIDSNPGQPVYDSGEIAFDYSGRLTDTTGAEVTFDG